MTEINGSSAADLAAVQGALGITALTARLAMAEAAAGLSVTALTPLKAKLAARQNASLIVIGDSTAYSEYGPYYKLATAIGRRMNATVVIYRWAEWVVSAATGPKAYSDPVTVFTGSAGAPTLTIYLAALPGAVAGTMFDDTRAAALTLPSAPDLIIWHHGHNQQSFEVFSGVPLATGVGTYMGPIGIASMKWPLVPQAICNQNPWRDSTGMDKIRDAIAETTTSLANVMLLDTYSAFVGAGKPAGLYRDNIHPNDTVDNSNGAELTASILMAYFERSASSGAYQTPDWTAAVATNLIANGHFADWTGAFPTGIATLASGTAAKNTTDVVDGAAWSMALSPAGLSAGNQNSGALHSMTTGEKATIAGKTVTLAVLVTMDPDQRPGFGQFLVTTAAGNAGVSFGGLMGLRSGKMWLVLPNIPMAAGYTSNANASVRLLPAFSGSAPVSMDPLIVHKVLVTEGAAPKGQIAP